MRINDNDAKNFDWNRCVGPNGNLAGLNPDTVAMLCDKFGVPWWTSAWPSSSGVKAYCLDDRIWNKICKMAK